MVRHICADQHEEILHLLPSNRLFNFRRVSKHWNELISSQRFIQKHLHRSRAGCNGTLIVTLSPSGISVWDDQVRTSIPYPPGFSLYNTQIAGSCDGLVCLVRAESEYFAIINPSTGKFSVRLTDGFVFSPKHCIWFGRHPFTGEYLIIAIELSPRMIQVRQFSSTLASLQNFFSVPQAVHFFDTILILLHGALHWPAYRENQQVVVLAYDIEKDKLTEILGPFEPCFDVRLGTVDGCLFAIIQTRRERKFELWIMKEYEVEESWTKYCNIIEGFEGCRVPYPLRFLAEGDLLLNVGTKMIVKYNFSDKKGTLLHVYRDDPDYIAASSAALCGDSLVSPSLIWGSSSAYLSCYHR